MLLINGINHPLHHLAVAAQYGQAQAQHPNILLIGGIGHQPLGNVFCLINLTGIGQRRGIANT